MIRVQRRAEHTRTPWRNGGGITHEVAASGNDNFDWRVSIAEVETSGPFSAFEGVDRVIMLIDGPWLDLTVDGADHRLEPFAPFAFDGASDTSCRTPGSTRDLNVMTRRGAYRSELEVLQPASSTLVAGGDPLLVVCLRDILTVQDHGTLEPWDTVIADAGETLSVQGPGLVAVIRLLPASAT